MVELLSEFIIHLIQSFGYVGIFVLMTLESALIPIPSEITMPFSGFLVSKGEFSFLIVVLMGALGNVAGSLIAYAIGYYLQESLIITLVDRYGKFLLITRHEYDVSVRWLRKYGDSVSFFSRLLPGVRTFISLPAGLSKINIWKFSLYTFFGSFIWSAFLTYIGVYLGNQWHSIEKYYRKFEVLIVVVFIAAVLWYINHKLKIFKFPN